uniref:transcription factor bHLH18-like n=1 Tax=Erigeron canadensis TaxID=72917 RepID=UPI001CB88DAE|nr:transcription factor bHLH18-like [Erigeron canadensis]
MDMSSAWLSQLEMQDQGFLNYQYHEMIKPYHHMVADFGGDSNFSYYHVDNKITSFVDQTFQIPTNIKEMSNNVQRAPIYKTGNSIIKKVTSEDHHENSKPKPNQKKLPATPPNTFTISFGDQKPKEEEIPFTDSFGYPSNTKKGPTVVRNRIQLQDHMLAERKRREKLAKRFISLSTLLPDLKKMDKATVLEDAANYIKELQLRVKELEELTNTKTMNMESNVSTKKTKLGFSYDDGLSSDETNDLESRISCKPEIKVRMSGSNVLIRIYCLKNSLSLIKTLDEVQKLDLSVTSSSTMPFANTTLLITIVAKKKDEFKMTSTKLAKSLQQAVSNLDDHHQQHEVQDFHHSKLFAPNVDSPFSLFPTNSKNHF